MEELIATYDRTKWTNEEQTFLIGQLADHTVIKGPILGSRQPVPNLTYRFSGKWKQHAKYGRQFEFEAYAIQQPKDRAAVICYLLRFTENCGIGPFTAGKLVDLFGPDQALAVLRTDPEQVAAKIKRLTVENCKIAARQLAEHERYESTVIDLTHLFAGRGFHAAAMQQCVDRWGIHAPEVIKRDPFKLLVARVSGAGFDRCDTMYLELGLPPGRLKRQLMCAWDFMRKDMSGSVWFAAGQVLREVQERVAAEIRFPQAVELGVRAGWLRREQWNGEWWLSVGRDAENEDAIAGKLLELNLEGEHSSVGGESGGIGSAVGAVGSGSGPRRKFG